MTNEQTIARIRKLLALADAMKYAARNLDEQTKADKPETEAQRRKREERERAARDRYYRYQARNAKGHGFYAGQQAGDGIGLDLQADYDEKRRLV